MKSRNLILILGDQLSMDLASLREGDKEQDTVVMGELQSEATYVKHHQKKIVFAFSAMRHFAQELEDAGWRVNYAEYGNDNRVESFTDLVRSVVDKITFSKIIVVEPGEWRVSKEIQTWEKIFKLPVQILEDSRFVCSRQEFNTWATDRKSLTMEFFYREMRKKTGLLMEGDQPVGGKWNYDSENRKPPNKTINVPSPKQFKADETTLAVVRLVRARFESHLGHVDPFWFAVTRSDAEAACDYFIDHLLPYFGDYQDAMLSGNKFLFHSLLSLYINVGLLEPIAVCKRVEQAFHSGHAPINAVEGFIRQIIGWREFMRGVYWREGPDYVKENFLRAYRPLPSFFWTGETEMACVKSVVLQTTEEAYAHHIQRLMVIGNFALIAGLNPLEVHEWFLAVYADAYEWVVAPNVIGMSQYADGGVVASKPYASSGAYINRMSDYCKTCTYSVSKKTDEEACPFNALYWDFLLRNKGKLKGNSRLSRVYANWERISEVKKNAYRQRACHIFDQLDSGGTL